MALPGFFGDVAHQGLVVRVVGQEHLRVAALGHQVGGNGDDGVNVVNAPALRTETKHGHLSFLVGRMSADNRV